MTQNSVICNFIATNTDWEEKLEALNVKVNREGDLAIFNYGIAANFSDPVVQEARGIIIDLSTLSVVCWPFRKFGNYQESYVDEIDWASARVQEKVDGSIIKLWYYNGEWIWSTNAMIYASMSRLASENSSYLDLIKRAVNYGLIKFDELNKDYTYIFELIAPENRVVIEYDVCKLVHIGTRNNKTGEEYDLDIGIEKPKTYPLSTFDEALEAIKHLNEGCEDVAHEGFVVVDKNWHRIKIKTEEYFAVHHTINNHVLTKKRCLNYIINEPESVAIIKANYPEYSHILMYYEYKLKELENDITRFIRMARKMYAEVSYDRKAFAAMMKGKKFAQFGFYAINNESLTGADCMASLLMSTLRDLIPEYVPTQF